MVGQDQVILHGVSWQTFQQLLADRGERCGVLLAYDRGIVELRMPSHEHEWVKTTLTQIVEAIAFARDLHYRSLGWTTFGREDLERGFEPEACFYLAHADAVSMTRPLDLTIDARPWAEPGAGADRPQRAFFGKRKSVPGGGGSAWAFGLLQSDMDHRSS